MEREVFAKLSKVGLLAKRENKADDLKKCHVLIVLGRLADYLQFVSCLLSVSTIREHGFVDFWHW